MVNTYFIDIGLKDINAEEAILDLLGPPTDSGAGFGLIDMQWYGIPEGSYAPSLLKAIQDAIPEASLAYVVYCQEGNNCVTPIIDYKSPWFIKEET